MFCKECGFSFSDHANFCPSCGKKVSEEHRRANLSRPSTAKWLKILLAFIFVGLTAIVLMVLFSDNMTETVSNQLKMIKENKFEEAYDHYTSQSFQKFTPLNRFREFMNNYPAFSHYQSVRFIDRTVENESGSLQAMILTDKGIEIPVLYRLLKEEGRWKISAIKLIGNEADKGFGEQSDETFDSAPLKNAIQGLMQQIRQYDLAKAYQDYTSQDFRKITPFKDFEAFINDNPIFVNSQSVELSDLNFDNNMATISGKVNGTDGVVYSVKYDLVQENGKWKIFHIDVLSSDQDSQHAARDIKFSKFVLGSGVDENGRVAAPAVTFKPNSGDIYLNLYANDIPSDAKIRLVFEHTDTHSTIPPVSKLMADGGDAILTFVFSPPPAGWPKGNYRLLAISSTGGEGSFDFKVEE